MIKQFFKKLWAEYYSFLFGLMLGMFSMLGVMLFSFWEYGKWE